jgi:hypothetical protein
MLCHFLAYAPASFFHGGDVLAGNIAQLFANGGSTSKPGVTPLVMRTEGNVRMLKACNISCGFVGKRHDVPGLQPGQCHYVHLLPRGYSPVFDVCPPSVSGYGRVHLSSSRPNLPQSDKHGIHPLILNLGISIISKRIWSMR